MKTNLMPKITLLLLLVSTLFFSCNRENSDTVDQDLIYAQYTLFYNANTDKTSAQAQFRFSNATGTILELVSPSTITFNGDALGWKDGLAYYEMEYAGFVDSGTFSYSNGDGNTFVNTVSIDTIGYPLALDTIDISQAFTFTWEGNALDTDDEVWLTIDDQIQNSSQIFSQTTDGATDMVLPLNKLSQLGVGPATCYLDRHNIPTTQQATSAGARLVGKYRPANLSIQLK